MPRPFAPLGRHKTALLTTFRRDGRAVATPVTIAVADGRAFFRTYESSGKRKRLRNNPHVQLAPSTLGGKALGPAIAARASLLSGADAQRASAMIARRAWILQGVIVPFYHWLMGLKTVHFELRPEET